MQYLWNQLRVLYKFTWMSKNSHTNLHYKHKIIYDKYTGWFKNTFTNIGDRFLTQNKKKKFIWTFVPKSFVFSLFKFISDTMHLWHCQLVRKSSTYKLIANAQNVLLLFLDMHALIESWTFPPFQTLPDGVKWLCSLPWHVDEELLHQACLMYKCKEKTSSLVYNQCKTRDKQPLGRDSYRSWCHLHTSVELFWSQLMAPWTSAAAYEYATAQLMDPWVSTKKGLH